MYKMKSIIGSFLISVFFLSCNSDLKRDNSKLIDDINRIEKVKIITQYEVDSFGKIIDTLSIEINKINENEVIVFKQKSILRNKGYLKSTNYYRDNKNLFYSKFESSELGILSISEFWEKDNKILKGLYFEYRDNKIKDTININYEYFYGNKDIINKTIITSKYQDENEIGNITELFYNDAENLTSEISVQYGDTLKVSKYTYLKKTLKNKTIKDYKKDIFVSLDYDEKGSILREEIFVEEGDSLIKISQTKFETNNKGDVVRSTQIEYPKRKKKYVIFNIEYKY